MRYLSPSTRVCTERMSVNGGSTATSTASKSSSVSEKASFCTRAIASRWLRFIFQLPAISGVRAMCAQSSKASRPGSSCPRGTRGWRRPRSRCGRTRVSSKPSCATAAAESPPPTTVRPPQRSPRSAPGRRRGCPRRRAPSRRRPSGRSRRRCARRRSSRRTACRSPGPMSSPQPVGRDRVDARRLRGRRRRRTSVAATMSTGSTISTPFVAACVEVAADRVDLVLLEQALADLVALSLEEGEDHAAADEEPVDRVEQVVDDAELVGDLGAAQDDDVRALRVAGELAQDLDLALHQLAGRVRQPLAARRRRWRACGARRRSRRRRRRRPASASCVGERAALGVVLARPRPALKRRFSSSATSPSPSAATAACALSPTVSVGELRPAGRAPRPAARRPARGCTSRPACPFGRPRCAHDDDARAAVGEVRDGRRAGPDPAVVGDRRAVERDVEVGADEDPLARAGPPGRRRSSRRLRLRGTSRRARPGRRGGWSSPTRCRTSRRP